MQRLHKYFHDISQHDASVGRSIPVTQFSAWAALIPDASESKSAGGNLKWFSHSRSGNHNEES